LGGGEGWVTRIEGKRPSVYIWGPCCLKFQEKVKCKVVWVGRLTGIKIVDAMGQPRTHYASNVAGRGTKLLKDIPGEGRGEEAHSDIGLRWVSTRG
jgi:hypothetical protein